MPAARVLFVIQDTIVTLPSVVLKPKRAQPFFGRHPWVYAGAIERIDGKPDDGAVVDLRSSVGNFIARGLFNSQSKIQVRLFSWDENRTLDDDFFRDRIRQAIALRHDILRLNDDPDAAYRVIFSEADGLSGLVVDRYGPWLTAQFTSLALASRREAIGKLLMEELGSKGIYIRTEKGIGKLEGITLLDGLLCGEPMPAEMVIVENKLKFAVNLTEGQKTGYYLDQRDNRTAVAKLCSGKRVLDAFSYSGGFGIYAAAAGATEVTCVDASEPALKLAARNAELNGFNNLTFEKGDVFGKLDEYASAKRKFDVVVLDPPKFARNRAAVNDALRGYRRLFELGLKLTDRDGVIVLCCCSGLIDIEMIEDVIAQVAMKAGRDVQILDRRGAAPDHPIAVACRESAYLKCVITRAG